MFNFSLNSKGQSIVEIVAAIAIGAILILALVALSVRSNRSADFSKIESQASRLATEGLEVVRNIQLANGTGIRYSTTCGGNAVGPVNWSTLFTATVGDLDESCGTMGGGPYGKKARIARGSAGCFSDTQASCLFIANDFGESITDPSTNRVFQRQIYVADSPPKSKCNTASDWNRIKQFTVVVTWSDASGAHESVTTSCLQRES
jgi:hypothetical protein